MVGRLKHFLAHIPLDEDIVAVYTSSHILKDQSASSSSATTETRGSNRQAWTIQNEFAALRASSALVESRVRDVAMYAIKSVRSQFIPSMDGFETVNFSQSSISGHLHMLIHQRFRASVWKRYYFCAYKGNLICWLQKTDVQGESSSPHLVIKNIVGSQIILEGSKEAQVFIASNCPANLMAQAFVVSWEKQPSASSKILRRLSQSVLIKRSGLSSSETSSVHADDSSIHSTESSSSSNAFNTIDQAFFIASSTKKRDEWVKAIAEFVYKYPSS